MAVTPEELASSPAATPLRWQPLGWIKRIASHQDIWWLVAIFLVAFSLRLAWIGYVSPDPADGRYDDTVWYDFTARKLADGKGYVFDPTIWLDGEGNRIYEDDSIGGPTALWPIGYPLILSTVYTVFGGSLLAAKLLNALLGAATALALYGVGTKLFNRRVGLLAAFLLALFPSHIFFSTLTMTEVTYTFLFVLLLYLIIAWTLERQSSTPYQLLALGLLVGAGTMVRGELLLFPVVMVAVWFLAYRSWAKVGRHLGLVLVGMAVLFAPWTVRNVVQMGAPIVTTTGMGQVLLQGHFEGADGGDHLFVVAAKHREFSHLSNPEREIEINASATREALRYAVTHPGHELRLIPRRLLHLYGDDESGIKWTQSNRPTLSDTAQDRLTELSNGYYFVVLGMAAVGVPFSLSGRDSRRLLPLMAIVYYTLMFAIIFFGHSRYHIPLLPLFSLLAAVGAVSLFGYLRTRRERAGSEEP